MLHQQVSNERACDGMSRQSSARGEFGDDPLAMRVVISEGRHVVSHLVSTQRVLHRFCFPLPILGGSRCTRLPSFSWHAPTLGCDLNTLPSFLSWHLVRTIRPKRCKPKRERVWVRKREGEWGQVLFCFVFPFSHLWVSSSSATSCSSCPLP